tara:strand:+ start:533 stop:1000 length:468 start_codon:yes stop_codon:yes gene_type:complete
MAHFAVLDESNIVTKVLVVSDDVITDENGVEQEQLGIDFLTGLLGVGTYKKTSYNENIRKNYAGIGYSYDDSRDAFIAPKEYSSWVFDEYTCRWTAPITRPREEGVDGRWFTWDEDAYQADNTTGWIEVINEHYGIDYPDSRHDDERPTHLKLNP